MTNEQSTEATAPNIHQVITDTTAQIQKLRKVFHDAAGNAPAGTLISDDLVQPIVSLLEELGALTRIIVCALPAERNEAEVLTTQREAT